MGACVCMPDVCMYVGTCALYIYCPRPLEKARLQASRAWATPCCRVLLHMRSRKERTAASIPAPCARRSTVTSSS
eukprot:1085788-Pyramimonas_sp.AAC.1